MEYHEHVAVDQQISQRYRPLSGLNGLINWDEVYNNFEKVAKRYIEDAGKTKMCV